MTHLHERLTTYLYFIRPFEAGPTPSRKALLDAIVAARPREAIISDVMLHGPIRVALDTFSWMLREQGADYLFPEPLHATLVFVRRPSEAPLRLTPLDLLERYHVEGLIPDDAPPEGLTTMLTAHLAQRHAVWDLPASERRGPWDALDRDLQTLLAPWDPSLPAARRTA